jgi:hypothetical protein
MFKSLCNIRGANRCVVCLATTVACIGIAFGQTNASSGSDTITLTVFAYGQRGDPVTDLQPGDITVSDAGHLQQIESLERNVTHKRQPIIILFDLLNSRMEGRSMVRNEIVQSLSHVESGYNLYLYILTKHATLYLIRGLEDYEGPLRVENLPWIRVSAPSSTKLSIGSWNSVRSIWKIRTFDSRRHCKGLLVWHNMYRPCPGARA